MRKDVYHLAEKLAAASEFNPDTVYDFLMACGKDMGCNPTKLAWVTGRKIIFLAGKRDDYCLETFRPEDHRPAYDDEQAEYWINRILARQEAWMD
jgi:hypothetical protein